MKNVVERYKHFFGYFNALETNGVKQNQDWLDFQNHTRVVFAEKCLCRRLSDKILLKCKFV